MAFFEKYRYAVALLDVKHTVINDIIGAYSALSRKFSVYFVVSSKKKGQVSHESPCAATHVLLRVNLFRP